MFKDLLLVVLVSVVWITTHATYLLDGNLDYGLYSGLGIDSYHSPLYQTHLSDYDDDDGGIVLSHLHNPQDRFIPKSFNPFQRSFRDSTGFREPDNKQGVPFVTSVQNNQNKESYGTSRLNQEQIEIKSIRDDYRNNQPQIQIQDSYQGPRIQQQLVYSGGAINQAPEKVNDYSQNNKQTETVNKDTQNQKYENTFQSKIEDFNRQQYVSSGFKPMYESTSVKSINSQNSYPSTQQKSQGGYQTQENNNINASDYRHSSDNKYNVPLHHGYQQIEGVIPVIYNQASLGSTRFLGIPIEVNQGYSEISDNLRTSGDVYPLRLLDGIGLSNLQSDGQIILSHGNHNLHNLNGEILYQIGDSEPNGLENIKLGLSGFLHNQVLNNGSEYETAKDSSSQAYSDKTSDSYAGNVEQKSIEIGLKSTPIQQSTYSNLGDIGSEYKGIGSIQVPNNYEMKMEFPALNVEQKSIEVGLKSNSGEMKSYNSIGDTNQYKDTGSPNIPTYSDSKPKSADVEQKSVEVDLKSDSGGYKTSSSYDSSSKGSDESKYPSTSVKNIEQKSVDINIKSSSGQTNSYDSAAEYDGIGSINAPKYPSVNEAKSIKKLEQKLEQKIEEMQSYQEIKSSIKSSQDSLASGILGSLKKDVSDSKSYDAKKNDLRNSGYARDDKLGDSRQYTTGSVSSYRDTGNSFTGNRNAYSSGIGSSNSGLNGLRYPDVSNTRPSNFGNSYFTSSGPTLKQTNSNYFGPGRARSEDNYQRVLESIRPTTYNSDFQRHISSPQSYLGTIGSKPPSIDISRRFPTQQSSYGGIGETSAYSGNRNNHFPNAVPRYHESVTGGISSPKYSDRRQPPNSYSRGFSPVSNLNTPTAPRYTVSHIQAGRPNIRPLATSVSYLEQANSGIPNIGKLYNQNNAGSIPSVDYSTGIGGSEYPGIGEISLPKSIATENKPYAQPEKPKSVAIEQKPYNDEPEITSSTILGVSSKSPVEEYSGIGEAGSAPLPKSEIVGGRYPQKRPIKSTKKNEQSGIKGKTEAKSPSKYLPITAALSGSSKDPEPQAKQYGSIKSTDAQEPEKIEQQELVYEALLAGPGSQSNAVGSSGFGFNRPPVVNTGFVGRPGSLYDKDENLPPMPYEFEFDIQDDEHGSEQYRQEKMDGNGFLTGRYGFKDAEGIFRQVEYEASKDGFKVNRIRTNEPGTDNEDPADVRFEVQKQR